MQRHAETYNQSPPINKQSHRASVSVIINTNGRRAAYNFTANQGGGYSPSVPPLSMPGRSWAGVQVPQVLHYPAGECFRRTILRQIYS